MIRLLFSYEPKTSFLHSIDPLSKLSWVACIFLLSLVFVRAIPQLLLLLSVVAVAVVLGRISIRESGLLVMIFTAFSLTYFVMRTFLVGGEHVLFRIGTIPVAVEGLDAAGTVAFRFLVLILSARVFVGTTEPRDLALQLAQKMHLPYAVAFSIFMLLRLLPLMEKEYRDVRNARKIRRAKGRPRPLGGFRALRDYGVTLLARGFRRSVVTAYSLESRAFRTYPHRTFARVVQVRARGKAFAICVVALTALSLVADKMWS